MATSFLSPISNQKTKMYAVVTVKWNRFILNLLRPLVTYFAMRIVKQDIEILAQQKESIEDFEGENFVFTDVDFLGASIMRLLKKASNEPLELVINPAEEPESVTRGELMT